MKKILIIVPFVFISCGQPVTQVLNTSELIKSESVSMKDLRPESEKKRKIFSMWVTNEAYSISRMGDASTKPSYARIFQHKAFEKYATSNASLNIELNHLVIYNNSKSQARKFALFAGLTGPIGGTIAGTANSALAISSSLVERSQFDSLIDKEHRRAFYTVSENPKKVSVNIVYIDSTINGKRLFTKTMVPVAIKGSKNVFLDAFNAAVEYHLNQHQELQSDMQL